LVLYQPDASGDDLRFSPRLYYAIRVNQVPVCVLQQEWHCNSTANHKSNELRFIHSCGLANPQNSYGRLAVAIIIAAVVIAAGVFASSYIEPATTVTRTSTATLTVAQTTVTETTGVTMTSSTTVSFTITISVRSNTSMTVTYTSCTAPTSTSPNLFYGSCLSLAGATLMANTGRLSLDFSIWGTPDLSVASVTLTGPTIQGVCALSGAGLPAKGIGGTAGQDTSVVYSGHISLDFSGCPSIGSVAITAGQVYSYTLVTGGSEKAFAGQVVAR
jgi:hypothetical protein